MLEAQSTQTEDSYDRVPYGFRIFSTAHPDRMAVVARLVGFDPAPIERCRVLDLGCASGGNLIPLAVALPGATFVGVDLSPRQIELGNRAVAELGLTNLTLHARDILKVGEDLGRFDYIICHGVFSWVPPPVQDHILSLCRRLLTPNGLAYVSYNCYPTWHVRSILRDAMLFHTEGTDDPAERVAQANAILEFMADGFAQPDSLLPKILKLEIEDLRKAPDWYIFHEYLEPVNQPQLLYQFVTRARRQGLAYLGDAAPTTHDSKLKPEVRQQIAALSPDPVARDQYVDFLTLRGFRSSILCHREAKGTRRSLAEALAPLRLSSQARPESPDPDPTSDRPVKYLLEDGSGITTNDPIIKAALAALRKAWPRSLPFPALCDMVFAALGEGVAGVEGAVMEKLAVGMVNSFVPGVVDLRYEEPPLVAEPGLRPVASPASRLWAREVEDLVVNLRHRLVKVDPFPRMLLPLLDGTRDREALLEHVLGLARSGAFSVEHQGQPVRDEGTLREVLAERIDLALRALARFAFLMA